METPLERLDRLRAESASIEAGYHMDDQGYVLEAIDAILGRRDLPSDDKVDLISTVLDAHDKAKG